MKITEALKSLENSWSREDILLRIKNGADSEKIVNDFFDNKQQEIQTLANFISKEDKELLSEMEELSNIESRLINKIKNQSFNNSSLTQIEEDKKNDLKPNKNLSFNLGLFMLKWSNKFVFASLLLISAIALTKQAWA